MQSLDKDDRPVVMPDPSWYLGILHHIKETATVEAITELYFVQYFTVCKVHY